MITSKVFLLGAMLVSCSIVNAQVITREDSLNAGLTPKSAPTVISGYGQAKVEYDLRSQTGTANLTRNVFFLGHRFSDKISFFSEMEIEDAKVEGGKPAGEISMEQLFLKFNINKNHYIVGGLFIPRIGIINENHLPTTFNSNDRPYVERVIIPSTWRELGVAVYGHITKVPGLNYSAGITNGLSSAGFEHGTGIRGGRFEGQDASASNIALHGSLLYYMNHFRIQVSSYYGGSAGLTKIDADSLKLKKGALGTPISLSEINIQYHHPKGFQAKALGCFISIKDAEKINLAYANNTPSSMYGYYVELGYNIFQPFEKLRARSMVVFARYEAMDLNASMPNSGVSDDFMRKQYLVAGLHFQPVKGISIKLDYVNRITGNYNPMLYSSNPYSSKGAFNSSNSFVNLGIGYSF